MKSDIATTSSLAVAAPTSLARSDVYPEMRGRVEVRETHISWVFLVGDRAYKLKKPLVLPFVNYGSPARRLEMCREEVRLNRRLAPDVYLGVVGVARTDAGVEFTSADDPHAIDYLVEMRRYDERDTLAVVLERGDLERSQIEEVGRTLARFHAGCRPADDQVRGSHRIKRRVAGNAQELLELAEQPAERRRIRTMIRFIAAFTGAHAAEFDYRATRGLIRECQGDIRAEHVLLGANVSVVDCVEFDVELRTLDVADDLAFLAMDLVALGGGRFVSGLIDSYRAAGGDCGSEPLMSFFAAHRALVRAKVLRVRALQDRASGAAPDHARARSRDLLRLAERFSWRTRLPLAIIVCGVPASGKSHLARALADAWGVSWLSSDVTRKRLAGVGRRRRAPAEIYGPEWNARTYAELGKLTAREVETRGGAIVDATFRRRSDRAAFRKSFGDTAPTLLFECQAPAAELAARADRRAQDSTRVSDADLEIVMRERSSWEPLDEIPASEQFVLRTDRPLDDIIQELYALLDRRL